MTTNELITDFLDNKVSKINLISGSGLNEIGILCRYILQDSFDNRIESSPVPIDKIVPWGRLKKHCDKEVLIKIKKLAGEYSIPITLQQVMLSNIYTISQCSKLIISNVENKFHYKMLFQYLELLYEYAAKYNCQLFIITQSYEVLEMSSELITSMGISDFQYHRFQIFMKNNNKLFEIVSYPLDLFNLSIDKRFEIR